MNSDHRKRLPTDALPIEFACRFLKNRGAAMERAETGYHVVLSDALSERLETPDLIHIRTDPDTDAAPASSAVASDTPAYAIHYGAPLLDRMISEATREIPVLAYQLHFDYIKSQGFDRLIAEQFSFPNAIVRVENQAVVRTEYVLIVYRYIAQSDEQKEGLVSLVFNLETGAGIPDMVEQISLMHRTLDNGSQKSDHDSVRVDELMQKADETLKRCIADETCTFQESMKRRFQRDVRNLTAYYGSLHLEMATSLKRPGLSQQLIRDRKEKIRLIPAERERKKEDLLKKYSIKISAHPCTLMRIKTAAVKLYLKASVGKATRRFPMIYNPVTKSVDPLVCQGCGSPTYLCTFCDRLHLLCGSCRMRCPVCHPG